MIVIAICKLDVRTENVHSNIISTILVKFDYFNVFIRAHLVLDGALP